MLVGVLLAAVLVGCEAGAVYIVPTARPTTTPTFTPSPSPTPAINVTPTPAPTRADPGGPSPTPLIGSGQPVAAGGAQTGATGRPTPTRSLNPNAPRIEFFTSDPLVINPGAGVTLFWSALNVDGAVIYRLDNAGERSQVYNVFPDGSLEVTTRSSDRGRVDFVLTVGAGANAVEARHSVLLRCPVEWFFLPAPDECASDDPEPSRIVDQPMERGRMLYIESRDAVYVLFNDGQEPAWLTFGNRYDPAIHPERDENAPPQWIQPLRELGFVWRTEGDVRARLGLGISDATTFEGFVQAAPAGRNAETLYISGADGVVLQLIPGGEVWQIIAP